MSNDCLSVKSGRFLKLHLNLLVGNTDIKWHSIGFSQQEVGHSDFSSCQECSITRGLIQGEPPSTSTSHLSQTPVFIAFTKCPIFYMRLLGRGTLVFCNLSHYHTGSTARARQAAAVWMGTFSFTSSLISPLSSLSAHSSSHSTTTIIIGHHSFSLSLSLSLSVSHCIYLGCHMGN